MAYIREFIEADGVHLVADALQRNEKSVRYAVKRMKRDELWDIYKGVWWQVGHRLYDKIG
ncbi:MAG TPA: hypothetical protein VLA13_08220 [Massilibacterium sp.]|nr:hypothetical protein [Massilibacterium sp.]